MDKPYVAWAPLVVERRDTDAVFAGWQRNGTGDVFALYTITAHANPFRGSTVSERTLLKMHLRVPETPPHRERLGTNVQPGSCRECPVETQCIGPYRSKTGCSAFPAGEEREAPTEINNAQTGTDGAD